MTFTHLETHSHFTLLAATPSVTQLADRAAADGMTHLALADTNALYGAVAFARACRLRNVQPVIGMTLTVASPPEWTDAPGVEAAGPGQLVLLALNPAGYRSLCRLSSRIQGSPDRTLLAAQGLAWEDIAAQHEGLLCLSGGRAGWIARFLAAGDLTAAQRYAGRLAGIFDDRAYLALELHEPGDERVVAEVVALGRRLGLPPVAVQPVYCLAADEGPKLALLAAIRDNRLLPAPRADAPEPPASCWLSAGEVRERFAAYPDAVDRTEEIAARCGEVLPDGRPIWPSLALPSGQSPDDALAARAGEGLIARYPAKEAQSAAHARLEHELAAITSHGYAPLFLIVSDIVRFAREHDIPVSTRGSVANCLVAYCTGITTVDPLEHDLLFERFLNPARANPPDIDLDFCSRRRDEVLTHLRETFGADRMAMVGTVSTMRPQSAVRETGKAYGLSEDEIDRLVALMPHGWHPDPRRRDRRTMEDVLEDVPEERLREVVVAAAALVGQPDHLSVHPGGAVVTPGPLTDVVPVQWAPKGFLITQFEHADVEAIGLPKMDLLGIRALTVLADAAVLVRAGRDPGFRLDSIPLNDTATGDLIERGETIGVFQCESDGAQRTLRRLKARSVRDLAIANAFFKPGPAMGGMADTFVRRYLGKEAVTYLHPALKPILGVTKGVLIFQEQVLRIATEVAGLNWAQADQIRRGMSHFGQAEMAAVQEQFVAGCMRPPPTGPGFTEMQARKLWEQIIPFAGYGFNQGHATAYADVSYRSAYLKAHYPAEFLCARLADYGGFHHPVIYAAEAVRLGIRVRPPHVNHSGAAFTLVRDAAGPVLYMGLGQVRDLRQSSVAAICEARKSGPFDSVRDLLARVELQPKEADHLARCGALDGLGPSRAGLRAEVEEVRRGGDARQLAFDFGLPQVSAESAADRLAWEQELLGWPVSVHPLAMLTGQPNGLVPLRRLPYVAQPSVTVVGVRLPGWTGGPGFFLGDGDTFIQVRAGKGSRAPAPWQPLLVAGRLAADEWGGHWLQAESITPLSHHMRPR